LAPSRPIHLSGFKELAIKVVAPTKKVGAFYFAKIHLINR